MSTWLRKRKDEDGPAAGWPEVEAFVPASARHPEANRFTPPGSDMPDDHDEDLEFFATLVKEVDGPPRPLAAPRRAPRLDTGADPRIDDMQLFRDMKDEGTQPARFDFRMRDVDMGDLLEELATVQAALRRKAA
jgi:hypothetical protein